MPMSDDSFSSDDFDKLLEDFINSQIQESEGNLVDLTLNDTKNKNSEEQEEVIAKEQNTTEEVVETVETVETKENPLVEELFDDEKRFFLAYTSFINASINCGKEADIEIPEFDLSIEDLLPRFKPNKISIIVNDIKKGWDILLKSQPIRLSSLPLNPSDEQILTFAEKTSNPNLQLALISYVESLLELDACEISYNLRYAKYQKHKLEKKLYEEKEKRRKKTLKYIEELRKKLFPIDEEMLVNNFFKTARKDPEGAQKILENNPATYAPIQTDKIPDRFFGLIKAKPSDGFKINKKLGKFLKDLKV